MNKIHLFLTDYHDIIFIFVALNGFRIMAKINIDLAVVLHDDCDYKDWLVELKKRFYSHRLKASCAPMATFISSMHHYRQIVRSLRTIL